METRIATLKPGEVVDDESAFDKCLREFSGTRRMIELLLAVNGYDLFANYKGVQPAGRADSIYDLPGPQVCVKKHDGTWKIYQTARSIIYGCIALKYLILSLLHFTMLMADNRSSNWQLTARFDFILEKLECIDASLGIRLKQLHSAAAIFYGTLAMTVITFVCVLPYYHCRISPLNSASLKFLLNPKFELERLDAAVKQKLDLAMSSMDRLQLQLTKEFGRNHTSIVRPAIRMLILTLGKRIASQRKMVECYITTDYRLVPFVYSLEWFNQSYRAVRLLLVFLLIGLLSSAMVLAFIVLSFLLGNQCKLRPLNIFMLKAQECNVMQAMNFQDYLLINEVIICSLTISITFAALISVLLVQMATHLKMTCYIKGVMNHYLDESRTTIEIWLEHGQINGKSLDEHLDRKLLESMINLWVYEYDIQKSTHTISKLMSAGMSSVAGIIALICLGAGGREQLTIWLSIILCNWLVLNIFVLIGATLQAEVSRVKKIVSSVVAETTRRALILTGNCSPKDPLAILWRKLAKNQDFFAELHSIKCQGIRVTFRLVLEANIFLISVILLYVTST